MDRHRNPQTQNLFFFVILLVAWGMVSLYIFTNFVPRFSMIGIALLGFLYILSLTELFPFAPWVSFLSSALVFSGVVYSLLDNTREVLITSGIGAGVFLITTILTVLYNRRIHQIRQKNNQLQQVVDSLVIYDRKTSLMRWKFAKQALTTEILRGRRYDTKLSVVLFEIWQKSQYPQEDLVRIHQEMADLIEETIREDIDVAFIGERIGLILPETNRPGASVLTERLIAKYNRRVDARISAGIASFPEDAVTEEELIERAEQALNVAMNTDREVISYNILEGGEEGAEEDLSEMSKDKASEGQEIQNTPERNEQTREKEEKTEVERPKKKKEEDEPEEEEKAKKETIEPLEAQETHHEEEDYAQILQNINLDKDEWVVWIQGFNQMAELVPMEKELLNIDHVQKIDFLFLQANHLVLRLKSSINDLAKAKNPFPGWKIKNLDLENHYLLLSEEK